MVHTPLLALHKIGKVFGARVLLRNLDLAVRPGDHIQIMGDNGCGKTTLLRIMANLSQPTTGRVERTQDLRMGYLGHATFIYSAMSALENLAFWARLYKIKPEPGALLEILERVGLHKQAEGNAGKFSRGMKQRLNFARLLMIRPHLYLLDEPFTGLDAASRSLMEGEITAATQSGSAVVMVTHDPSAVGHMATAVRVISKGRLEPAPTHTSGGASA